MNTTSESLLLQLRHTENQAAWARFSSLYTPLLFYWARNTGLRQADAADLVQDVMLQVFEKIREFEYDAQRSFRGWLRTITLNKFREHRRRKKLQFVDASGSLIANVPDEVAASTWDINYQKNLVSQAMELVAPEFRPATWQALKRLIQGNQTAAEVARETGVSVWTLYAARSRLLARLRERLDGLMD